MREVEDAYAVPTAPTPAAGYLAAVRAVLGHGDHAGGTLNQMSIGSSFGIAPRRASELIGYGFRIERPTLSLPVSPGRTPDVAFACAHLVWALAGSDSLESIRHYNERGALFSDDGRTLIGAPGPRLAHGLSGLNSAVQELRQDVGTRRAVIPLLYPSDDKAQRDFPCALAIQFVHREGALSAVAFMRSQSAALVLPYDLFFFLALQYIVAAAVGVPVGRYHHICGSIHVYEDELPIAERVVAEGAWNLTVPAPRADVMRAIAHLIVLEQRLRSAVDTAAVLQVVRDGQDDPFTSSILSILAYHALSRLGVSDRRIHLKRYLSEAVLGALTAR